MTICVLCLLAMLVANPLSEGAVAQTETPAADFERGLVDVNGLYVVVEVRRHPTWDPDVSGLSSQLERLVQSKLEEAGIPVTEQTLGQTDERLGSAMPKVVSRRLDVDANSVRWKWVNVPVLRIAVNLLSSEAQAPVALYAQTCFTRLVHLGERSDRSFKAIVWCTDPVLKSVRSLPWRDSAEKVVLEQVESFVAARKAAAPHDGEAPILSIGPALPRGATGAWKFPFVASKNSSVFHRADCRLARNISEGNLVGYKSREEAIQDGKRPCKSCTP